MCITWVILQGKGVKMMFVLRSWWPVYELPAPGVRRPVPSLVHRHLDHILEDGGAESAGDAGGGAQGGAGVDLEEPGPEVRGQHEVRPVKLIAVLTSAAAVHHVWAEVMCIRVFF